MSRQTLRPPVSLLDHTAGSFDAPVTLLEYGDFECPYCRLASPIVKAARRELGELVRFAFRHFPLAEIHPHARNAAQAAEAAGAQGQFWEMHDSLFRHQNALEPADLVRYARTLGLDATRFTTELESGALADRVREHFQSGVKSGVNATPTFFVNGVRYDGSWSDQRQFIGFLHEAAATALDMASSAGRTSDAV